MSIDPTCEFDPDPQFCTDCNERLSGKAVEHGLEGFGHQQRCCACYDAAMGAPADVVEKRRAREKTSPSDTVTR